MAQRSTGVFPREKFDLDAQLEVAVGAPAATGVNLSAMSTIRVIVFGATFGEGGTVEVTVGGKDVVFASAGDLDANGVGIAHLRGSLCDNNNAGYALTGEAAVTGVYLDAVDNVG